MTVRTAVPLGLAAAPTLAAISTPPVSTAEHEVRARRAALTQALNRVDVKAVRTFLAPDFRGRSLSGERLNPEHLLAVLDETFQASPDFQETLRIDRVEPQADAVVLHLTRTPAFNDRGRGRQRHETRAVETWKKFGSQRLLAAERAP